MDESSILNAERIESLRLILEAEKHRPVSPAEAENIGRGLLRFFGNLSSARLDEIGCAPEEK